MSDQGPKQVGELDDGVWTKTIWIPQIDGEAARRVERLKGELDLDAAAATDGRQLLPAPTDKTLNATQLAICDQVFHEILMLNEFLAQELGAALKRARSLVPARLNARLAREQMTDAVQGVFVAHHKSLLDAKKRELEKERNLSFFKHTNGLVRSVMREDRSQVKPFAMIFVLFLFESVMNGSLLSEVLSGGLVEGAGLAGFISLLNIVFGLVAGFYGWRYLSHRRLARQLFPGWTVTLLCHATAIFWNLLVAHFREASEVMATTAGFNFDPAVLARATWEHVVAHGLFGVTSVQSLGLLLLGIIIHFVSAKEGWDDISDRYPDYLPTHKEMVEAAEDYQERMAEVRDQGREAIEAIETRFQRGIDNIRRCCDGAEEMINMAAQRRQEVRNSEDKCVAAGTQLLKVYRETNIKIRNAGTAPAYFQNYPTAADYRRRGFGGEPSGDVARQEQTAEDVMQAMVELRDQAKTALDEAEQVLGDVKRGVTLALRALDQRIEAEGKQIATEAEEWLRRGDAGYTASPPAPAAESA